MAGFESIGFCGVNCGACADFAAKKCGGCRPTVKGSNEDCFFVKCCREHGVPHCGKCTAFPCTDIKEFAEESDSHKEAFSRLQSL